MALFLVSWHIFVYQVFPAATNIEPHSEVWRNLFVAQTDYWLPHVYTILTASVTHINIEHLLRNIGPLLIFGSYIEYKYSGRFLLLLVGLTNIVSVVAVMFTYEFIYNTELLMVGISGGVYAVITLSVLTFIFSTEHNQRKYVSITFLVLVLLRTILGLITSSPFIKLTLTLTENKTTHTGHAVGIVIAISVFVLILFRNTIFERYE